MDEQPISEADARNLRFLRGLVMVLTTVMIVGMVVVVALLVSRLRGGEATFSVPSTLELPEGVSISAVTQSRDRWIVVSEQGDVFFFTADGGAPVRVISAEQ